MNLYKAFCQLVYRTMCEQGMESFIARLTGDRSVPIAVDEKLFREPRQNIVSMAARQK